MEDLLVCRICLLLDVQMYNLRSSPLDEYFESLCGLNPHSHELLTYVCAECAVLINKCYMFKEKCLKGFNILQDMLQNNVQIMKEQIQSIDREHHKLSSTITLGLAQNNYFYLLASSPSAEPCSVFIQEPAKVDSFISIPLKHKNDEYIKEENIDSDYGGNQYSDDDIPIIKMELKETGAKKEINELKEIVEVSEQQTNKLKTTKKLPKKSRVRQKKTVSSKSDNIGKKKCLKSLNINTCKLRPTEQIENKMETSNSKIIKKTRIRKRTHSESGDSNTKRKKIVRPLDKEITKHFDVSIQTLEEQKAEIKARQYSASYQNATLRCTICFKVFVHQHAYDHHKKKHDPSFGPIECEVCGFRFRYRRSLVRHRTVHTHKFVCKICHQVLHSGPNARAHRVWHTGVTFECEHCLETFSHKTTYLSHLRIKHPSQHICNICGYSFLNEKGLNQHRISMHKEITHTSVELTGPRCDKCAIQFVDQEAFDRHLANAANHTGDPNFATTCRQCGVSFTTLEELRSHRRLEHPREKSAVKPAPTYKSDKDWPKKCHYCEEMIPTARENWYHHQRDHPNKEYSYTAAKLLICEVCGHKCANEYVLRYHVRDKHMERPHACPHCPKSFGTPYKLKLHLRSHSDEKPYACSVCSWAFRSKGNLQTHEKTHLGLRPHSCKICGKSFGSTTTRNCHVKFVHYKAPPSVRNRKPKRGNKEPFGE